MRNSNFHIEYKVKGKTISYSTKDESKFKNKLKELKEKRIRCTSSYMKAKEKDLI